MSTLEDLPVDDAGQEVSARPVPRQVEIRRNQGVSAAIGAAASAVAIAWFGRAIDTGGVVDWLVVVLMGVLGAAWLASFADARTPLLVADTHGARVRLGRGWVGLPWTAVEAVEHSSRRGPFRDGRIELVAHTPERLLAGLAPAAARQARLATAVNGGPLALPLGWGTSVIGSDHAHLGADLAALADAGEGVGVLVQPHEDQPHDVPVAEAPVSDVAAQASPDEASLLRERPEPGARKAEVSRPARERLLPWAEKFAAVRAAGEARREQRAVARATERADIERLREVEAEALREAEENAALARAAEVAAAEVAALVREGLVPSETPDAVRAVPAAARSEVVHALSVQDMAAEASPEQDPAHETQAPREAPVPMVHPVEPIVIDEHRAEPAREPVIGPELRAARTRLGMTVDALAERTRVRPHVIEALEVDDFAPCGGDFYARGHLRTLARTLGVDPEPLLVRFDERYAQAPVAARAVFEADLATAGGGPIRGTRGGPNWSVLVAAVMAVVLMWSVAQLLLDRPAEEASTPVLNGSGGPQGGVPVGAPVEVTVHAPTSGAEVVVRDAAGQIVFNGSLAIGESSEVEARAPVRVQSSDGSVTVTVDGRDRGPVGAEGDPAQGTYAGD